MRRGCRCRGGDRRIERGEAVKALSPRPLVIETHAERQVELAGHLVIVINVGGAEVPGESSESRNEEAGSLDLPKQERRERVARGG